MLIDEIKRLKTYAVIVYGGEHAYIEGVKRIVSLTAEKITADCGRTRVVIEGEQLCLSEADGGSLSVQGRITAVREEKS